MSARRQVARMIGTFAACQRPFGTMTPREHETVLYMRGNRFTELLNLQMGGAVVRLVPRTVGGHCYIRTAPRITGVWITPHADLQRDPNRPWNNNLVDSQDIVRW